MKTKIATIPKTKRERKRYVEIKTNVRNFKKILFERAIELLGINTTTMINISFIKDSKYIVKINRESVDDFLNILNYIAICENELVLAQDISGTIKGLKDAEE